MTTATRTVTVQDPESTVPPMALDLPAGWVEVADAGPVLGAFSDARSLDPGIASNATLTAVPLAAGTDLEAWQSVVREEQLSTLPDLQVIEDRRLDTDDGTAQWHGSSVMTDPNGATLLVRRWSRVVPGIGLTLTLTTLPTVDARHGELFDGLAASWRLGASPRNGDSDARS